ncbi:MAG: hypothetical protein EXR07_04800 [Acetobacteraceae bacterium]|nr:hypothetical protein [Acetobacteraceae bacterium]
MPLFGNMITMPDAWTDRTVGGKAGPTQRLSPANTRHRPRLWLRFESNRPIAAEILERANIYERIYRERSGRVPVSAMA